MVVDMKIRKPLFSLWFISLGGWLLHLKIHAPSFIAGEPQNPANLIPYILGLLNVILVPCLFLFKKTVILAYLINGFSVVIGAITMGQMSWMNLPNPLTLQSLFIKTALPYIFISLPKLWLGQSLLEHYYPAGLGRMFTAYWWVRHFIYFAVVYSFGIYLRSIL
jgi:hypothetical protein